MRRALLALSMMILLLAGCTTGGDPVDPAGAGEEVASIDTPAYPRDQAVLQVAHGGGLVMPDRVSKQIPDVTLWGDGRVVFAAPDGTVREGRLEPEAVDRLVGRAAFLYDLLDDYAAVAHTDAPMATFTVLTKQGRKTVSVYGLDPRQPRDGEPHPEIFGRLRELWAEVDAALPADAPEMAPDDVRVLTFYADGEATADWPVELQGRLTGEAARRAVDLAGLGEARTFRVDGKAQRVLVVPVLPGPWAWEEPATPGG